MAYAFTTILSNVQNSGYYQFEGINNNDQIIFSNGTVYTNGTVISIPSPPGENYSSNVAINNSGVVLTYSGQGNNPYYVVPIGGSPAALAASPPPGSPTPPAGYGNFVQGVDINDSGIVLGFFDDDGGVFPFLYATSTATTTLLLNPVVTYHNETGATALNNLNQVIGDYYTYDSGLTRHGYLYDPNVLGGTWTTLDYPTVGAGGATYLRDINDAGQIIGQFSGAGGNGFFLYSDGQYVAINDPLATAGTTVVTGINNSGAVVGYYQAAGVYHGFVYSNGSYTTVDNPLATQVANQTVKGTLVYGANDAGDLVGIYYDSAISAYGTPGIPHYFTAVISAPEIAVFGIGVEIADGDLTPASADLTDFGVIAMGAAGIIRTFTVSNTGTATLHTSDLTLPTGFTLVEALSATISAGASDTFQVRLDTTSAGVKAGQISFSTDDADENPFNFSITGAVTPPAAPEVLVTGNGIDIAINDASPDTADGTDFGAPVIGTTPAAHSFTVNNTGNAALTISGFKLPKGFVQVGPSLPASIVAGGSATVQVRLDTLKPGAYTGDITFTTNDADEKAFKFRVNGSVTQPEIDVLGNGLSIKDGSKKALITNHTLFDAGIGLGDAPAVRTFTITNAAGAADLTIGSATLAGSGFTLLTSLAGTVLATGASVTFDVAIDTAIAGTRSATIQINNNDANEAAYDFVVTGTVGPRNIIGSDAVSDAFVATAEPERFSGLDGTDTVSYANGTGPVVASLLSPLKNTGFAAGDLYVSIENLIGSDFADTLTGNTFNNVLEGGLGADKLDGGLGIDTASYANAGDAGGGVGVTANLLSTALNAGGAAGDTYKNIENLLGSAFSDTLVGNTLNNAIDGGAGDDTIAGNGGIDSLSGGLGGDTFRFNATKDGGTTGDVIVDFVSGEDHIGILRSGFKILSDVDVGGVGAFDFASHYFVSAVGGTPSVTSPSGVTATETGHGQFLFNETSNQLWWDQDGAGVAKAMLLATLQNGAHVLATDFDLI